ncbi:MAG: tyrosine-type recombinase/integrase, partial [candidate division NC10 bacterium]
MGCTVREKDGAWWVFIHHQGRTKAKRIGPGRQGRDAAKVAAAKIQAKLVLGELKVFDASETAKTTPTFEAVAKEWERVAAPNWKRGTQITYANALRCRLFPVFGALPIDHVTPAKVEAWWTATRREGLSRRRLGILRNLLKEVCRRAVRQGLIPTNPADCIEGGLGRDDAEVRKTDYLTPEDLHTLLTKAEECYPKEYPIFLVMATAGLRIGEAVALQAGDLDAPSQQVHIRRMVRQGYISSPKSGKGRVVDLPSSTVAVLENVRQTRQVEAAYHGTEARWLFPGRTPDLPITPEAVQQAFAKALKVAGIRKLRPHDLRHTYATLAVKAGVPLLTVSRQLGHA